MGHKQSSNTSCSDIHLVDGAADGAACGHDGPDSAHDDSSCTCVQACRQHVIVSTVLPLGLGCKARYAASQPSPA